MSGETIVDMLKLNLIVGSGGVLSHAPRRSQAMRMIIDSFSVSYTHLTLPPPPYV